MGASPKLIEANQRIGRELRQKSLDKYYEDPNHCLNCGQVIHVKDNEVPAIARSKRYCSKSCAAHCNNHLYPKRKAGVLVVNPNGDNVARICRRCGTTFEVGRYSSGKPRWRKHCDACISEIRSEKARDICERKGTALPKPVGDMTKKELREHYTWHLHYKTTIGRHAKKVFSLSGQEKICKNCGFVHGIQVCHIKSIASFSDETLISEINNISNLTPLCPNCHWLFDHGILKL
jgi:hypothetical protein